MNLLKSIIIMNITKPVKDFEVILKYNSVKYVIDSLRLMKHMQNLEKAHITFEYSSYVVNDSNSDYGNDFTEFTKYAFPNLRYLYLVTDISLPFVLFQNCKSIVKLEMRLGCSIEKQTKLYKILKNSKSSMKTLLVCLRMEDSVGPFLGKIGCISF